MGKLFGTDGIRGIINSGLDGHLAYRVGQAAAAVLTEATHHRPMFMIGKDTRASGDLLESALAAGICSTGADVVLTGVTATPAVAWLTVRRNADAGVVISASHNPAEYNGIKIFNGEGYKLSDELEDRIETLIASGEIPLVPADRIGRICADKSAAAEYIGYLQKTAGISLDGLRVAVDCANGAASVTAPALLRGLGAEADVFFCEPDGHNINQNCGSTHLAELSRIVTAGGYAAGLAFDGDADRFLAVDELGREVNGDRIMAVCAQAAGAPSIVATVLSNLGLHAFCRQRSIRVIQSGVGDRYVLEEMLRGGHRIGGEQSGHIIFLDDATTGDGQLTALKLLAILKKTGRRLSELADELTEYPQVMHNVRVPAERKRTITEDPHVAGVIAECETLLGSSGRILVRPSGTEALVRVMVEAADGAVAESTARRVVKSIETVLEA